MLSSQNEARIKDIEQDRKHREDKYIHSIVEKNNNKLSLRITNFFAKLIKKQPTIWTYNTVKQMLDIELDAEQQKLFDNDLPLWYQFVGHKGKYPSRYANEDYIELKKIHSAALAAKFHDQIDMQITVQDWYIIE